MPQTSLLTVLLSLGIAFAAESEQPNAAEALAAGSQFPVSATITLLSNVRLAVKLEGEKEDRQFKIFSAFCGTSKIEATLKIQGDDGKIQEIQASTAEMEALRARKIAELQASHARLDGLKLNKQMTEAQHQRDLAKYTAHEADLSKAKRSLKSASEVLQSKKPAALLEVMSSLQGLSSNSPSSQKLGAFVQRAQTMAGVDPSDPEYKFHSQGLIDICDELFVDFTQQKQELDDEWAKTVQTYDETIANLVNSIETTEAQIKSFEEQIASITEAAGLAQAEIVKNTGMKMSEEEYLHDVETQCTARTRDYNQRTATRKGEIEAIESALEVLSTTVAEHDLKVNNRLKNQKRSLVAVKEHVGKAVSFLQESGKATARTGLLGRVALRSQAQAAAQEKVLALIRSEAQQQKSATLAALAIKISDDPFYKIKELITGLFTRLKKELTEETDKQMYCNKETAKSNRARDKHFTEMQRVNSEIARLQAKQHELEVKLSEDADHLVDLQKDLDTAAEDRAEGKATNEQTLKEGNEGLDGVRQAIKTLQDFYRRAKIKADIHDKAEDHKLEKKYEGTHLDAKFHGSIQGHQADAAEIIGMMQVIESDFKNSIKEVSNMDYNQQSEFSEFKRQTLSTMARTRTGMGFDKDEKDQTEAAMSRAEQDLKRETELTDSELRTLEDLKPVCVDIGMSYQERKDARFQEITTLKKALCSLDSEGVEPECQES